MGHDDNDDAKRKFCVAAHVVLSAPATIHLLEYIFPLHCIHTYMYENMYMDLVGSLQVYKNMGRLGCRQCNNNFLNIYSLWREIEFNRGRRRFVLEVKVQEVEKNEKEENSEAREKERYL